MGLVQFNVDPPQEVKTLEQVKTTITKEDVLQDYKDLFKGLRLLGHTSIVTDPAAKKYPLTHFRGSTRRRQS